MARRLAAKSDYRFPSSGLLDRHNVKASKKGKGFKQPEKPHQHWHIDISYLNLGGTFYFLISVLDGYSRFIVHWDICEAMREQDVELALREALEKHPGVKPRIISDNGPQFIAKDFKVFLRIFGLCHARTSPYYPQSNGKLERWHGTIKDECIRPSASQTVEEATRHITDYVEKTSNSLAFQSTITRFKIPVLPEPRQGGDGQYWLFALNQTFFWFRTWIFPCKT